MEMLIIGSGCVLGYWLNKNGKQNRITNRTVIVSPNKIPNGPLIYDSNRVKDVDEYVRDLAARKHANKVRQMYPLDYDAPINIFPDDHNSELPAKLIDLNSNEFSDAIPKQFQKNVQSSISTNTNTAAYDPQSGHALLSDSLSNVIDDSPMFREFRSTGFKHTGQDATSEFGMPVSMLTGMPLDMTHANMQPMFGKMIRQPAVSNENSQVLLEKFTGMPSSDDQGTYREKREVLLAPPNNPDNLERANINQVKDMYERVQFGVKPSSEFVSPVKSFRDSPLATDQIRILPPNIDELRGPGKKQVTYEGVMVSGQKGSTRGMIPQMRENKFEMMTETKGKDFLGNRSTLAASGIQVIPNVRSNNATAVTEGGYLAPPTEQRKVKDLGALAGMYKNQMDESVTRRMESFTPSTGLARGREKGPNTGVFLMNDPEKGFENEYTGQPYQNTGTRMRNVASPDYTVRDSLAQTETGPINPNGKKDNNGWKKVRFDVVATNKSMNEVNKYKGQPHKNFGMGNRKAKIEEWTTNKETNQFSQTGLPTSQIPAHMSYEAVFEMDTNKEVQGDHYGIAKGEILKPISSGGKVNVDPEKLMVSDYINNPTGPSQGRNRKEFVEGITQQTAKLEFGGYYKHAKMGNGEDGKRQMKMRLKDENTVTGRINVPMKRDNPQENLAVETNLKPEVLNVERKTVHRTQPTELVTDRMPVTIRTRNVETPNPRLDGGIRVTNDLFPWIKDKSGTSL